MYAVRTAERETVRNLPGIQHRTLAGSSDGLKRLSVWQQTIGAGSATPPHRHDCEEVVLVVEGRGELHIGGGVHAFEADTVLIIPANAEHQIVNCGSGPMSIVAALSTTPVEVFFPNGEPIALPWQT